MKVAVIRISPESKTTKMDVKSNGVSNLDMLEFLNVLVEHFAKAIIKEARDLGCKNDEDFEGYVEFLRKNKL